MSMEITNNYDQYLNNEIYSIKKNKQADKQKNEYVQGSGDRVQEYYVKLCKKFPQISFNTQGSIMPCCPGKTVVNISLECLKKMANDPEFAKEVEWNLSGEVAANSLLYSWAKRDGVELGGPTVKYDANGNREASCGGMRTANVGNGNNSNKIQKKYKEDQERWMKARKKREEKEKLEKKRAEKKAEEERLEKHRAEMEEISEKYTVSSVGTDIENVTSQLISSSSLGITSGTVGFDVKA